MIAALLLSLLTAEPVLVTPPSFSQAQEPQIAIDRDETVYIAFGSGDAVYVSVSTDRGSTYGQPFKVGEPGKLSLGMRRGPRIAVNKGVATVTAIYGAQGKGRDGDVVAFRSANKANSWNGPVRVNDVEGSAREGLHAMAAAPDGTLACTWLDLREKGTRLYLSVSKDGGATWSENRLVYASPSGTICECCHPSLAFDSKGKLYVMFRNSISGARDMFLTSSEDLRTFSPASKLGTGTWMLEACPMDGGMLSVGPDGSMTPVWRRERTVYRGGLNGSREDPIGQGDQPWVASGKTQSFVVWQTGRNVFLKSFAEPQLLTSAGNDPVIATSPKGDFQIVAWTESGIRALRLQESPSTAHLSKTINRLIQP